MDAAQIPDYRLKGGQVARRNRAYAAVLRAGIARCEAMLAEGEAVLDALRLERARCQKALGALDGVRVG